jgi:ankyrin repeat protein
LPHAAAINGHPEMVKLLLDRGVDATVPNNDRWMPLYAAANNGHREVVRLLFDRRGGVQITEGVVTAITEKFDKEVMMLLLDRLRYAPT